MKDLLLGINYCHSIGAVHRDLKPENIIIKDDDTIKIIDFGVSTIIKKENLIEIHGTSYYVAPEVLDKKYNEKCDIWSWGVIMFVMLCGFPPFNGKNNKEILKKVKIGNFYFKRKEWDNVSDEAKNLITKMLEKNIELRFSSKECLQNIWFKDNNVLKNNFHLDICENLMNFEVI